MLAIVFGSILAVAGLTTHPVPHPAQLNWMLKLQNTEGGRGWGVALAAGQVLTVAHLEEGNTMLATDEAGKEHHLVATWVDHENDLALYQADAQFSNVIKISKTAPEAGEEVYWRVMLGHNSYSWTRGLVLGVDETGDLLLTGWFHPGTSGSGVLNSHGELVGIVSAGENWSARGPKVGLEEAENLDRLFTRTSFPPVLACRPINKLPQKPVKK